MAVQPQRVFISYGRADALKFAQRLAADLQRGGGRHVWLDLEGIEKGGLFEVGIERGIRESSANHQSSPMKVKRTTVRILT